MELEGIAHVDGRMTDVFSVDNAESRYPFNLKISVTRRLPPGLLGALTGPGLYLLSFRDRVVYVGMLRPAGRYGGDLRWYRHLQTITMRGAGVGLGGQKSPPARLAEFHRAVPSEALRNLLTETLAVEPARFRDSGVTTSINRAAFAAEHWDTFGNADAATILNGFSLRMYRIMPAATQAATNEWASDWEHEVLRRVQPQCNKEYRPCLHRDLQATYTVPLIRGVLRDVADVQGRVI